MEKPEIVSAEEWQQARDELLKAEKEATRALGRARRAAAPPADGPVRATTTSSTPRPARKTLLDLFEGRGQLVVYQFMDNGPDDYCPGCTWFTNNVPATALPAAGRAAASPG